MILEQFERRVKALIELFEFRRSDVPYRLGVDVPSLFVNLQQNEEKLLRDFFKSGNIFVVFDSTYNSTCYNLRLYDYVLNLFNWYPV